jgi:glycosyltransferase involved in cell wall biosynthesis
VTIICWDRTAELPAESTLPSGVAIRRIHEVRTVYGAGARQVLHTPRFWAAATREALKLKPDLVHCHDLDTLYAGVRLKKQLGSALVFDAHEDYPTQMSLYLPGIFMPLLNVFERWLLKHADAVLAASTVFMDKLRQEGYTSTVHIPNVPDLAPYANITREQAARLRLELELAPDDYVVSYIGGFTRNRQLLPLVEAVRSLPEVKLVLCGDGHQREAVEAAVQGMSNARYLGWLAAEKVPLYNHMSDVMYYCLKADYPGAKYNAPNTLANAMAAGRPVIANNVGDLGRMVSRTGCGLLLEEVTPQTIGEAIRQLADPTMRRKMGEAGWRAAESELNWRVVEKRLLEVYDRLVGKP